MSKKLDELRKERDRLIAAIREAEQEEFASDTLPELAKRLAISLTKSGADASYMSYQDRCLYIHELLVGLNRLAKDGSLAAAWALEWIEENSDVSQLRRWKEEVLPILTSYVESEGPITVTQRV